MLLIKRKLKPVFILARNNSDDLVFSDAPVYFVVSNNYAVREYNSPDFSDEKEVFLIKSFSLEPNMEIFNRLEESKRLTDKQQNRILEIFNNRFRESLEEDFQNLNIEVQGDTIEEMINQLESVLKIKKLLKLK